MSLNKSELVSAIAEKSDLTKAQAEYLGVDVAGPYKADHYRY